jgi:signal transduction histidine kinase
MAGAVWGSAIFIVRPDSWDALVPIAMAMAGVMAGGVSVLSYLVLSYVAFAVPIAISLASGFFFIEQQIAMTLGFMVVVYIVACLYFSRAFNRVLIEALRLRNEKDVLMADLRIKKELAEQANLAKSRFLAAASHDLRQPLHALSLLFEAVKETDSGELRKSLYPKIDVSLEALSSLFNSLLDISKLDAGVVEATVEDFRLQDAIRETIYQYEAKSERKNLSLRLHCGDCVVRSDRIFIERIISNLLSNAIRYTDAGGVLVSCRKRGNHVLLQVWDTGIGIAENEISNVFGEFYQLHNIHRDRKQGLGLGLSIVKRLCKLLDHPLKLRSRPGSGTVVSLLLPAGDQQRLIQDNDAAPNMLWSMAGLCVMVIDDDIEVLKATSVLLNKWGCQVITANSSADALEKISSARNVDLILSDLRLPGNRTGIQVLDSIRDQLGRSVSAILITGDTKPERISLAQQSGYKVLHKPLKPAQLRTAIHMELTSRTVRQ